MRQPPNESHGHPADNPLALYVTGAKVVSRLWAKESVPISQLGPRSMLRLPAGATFVQTAPNRARTIEEAGVVGLYTWILAQRHLQVVFANDLAYSIHGIDAIAWDRRTRRYVVCEAKGTTRRIGTPASYLRPTQTKGLQLSWEWCWASLIDFAEVGPTAAAFLKLYRVMIDERVDRLLAITTATRSGRGFRVGNTTVCVESELQRVPELAARKDWTKHRQWLREIGPEAP